MSFGTLTAERYHWDEIMRIIAQVEGVVDGQQASWIKGLSKSKRHELVNKYPLFVAWYCAVKLELQLKTVVIPCFGAHAYVAVFEWSPTGGMVHLHYILWKDRAPRFDLQAAELLDKAKALRRAGLVSGGQLPVVDVKHVVDYFEQYINEWSPNKTAEGRDGRDVATGLRQEQEPHTAALSLEEIQHLLRRENAQQLFD